MLAALALLVPQSATVAASAMPEAPNCPIYASNDVWHSSIQNMPVHPRSATWIANMGGSSRLLHPDFGGPYGYQLQITTNATPTTRLAFDYADESDDVAYPFTATTPIEPASDAHAFNACSRLKPAFRSLETVNPPVDVINTSPHAAAARL